jgi:basic membrane protein A
MVKRVDVAVFRVARDARERRIPRGTLELGLAQDGVGLTDFAYTKAIVGAAAIARLARLRRAIIDGRIVPPSTREELAAFRPVALR